MDSAMVERAIADSDWKALLPFLYALADEERTQLRGPYRARWRAAARRANGGWRYRPRIVQLGLAIGLAETPDEASKNCAWAREFAWTDEEGAFPYLAQLLLARGLEWAEKFSELATATRVSGEAARGAGEIAALTIPVYARSDRQVPEGTLALGWTQIVNSAAVASSRPDSHWIPIRLAHPTLDDGSTAYPLPTHLEDVLRATPRIADLLSAALLTPNALGELAKMTGAEWDVETAVRSLVAEGLLNRDDLIDETLSALTRADRPSAQRVMAALLKAADLAGGDAATRLPLISHLMAVVHGSVTGVLLVAALDADLDDDALLDIGTVILARKEKAQKQTLLKTLSRHRSSATAQKLLAVASEDADAAFAAKARSMLGEGTPAVPSADDVIWSIPVGGYHAWRVPQWSADAAGLDAAWSDSHTWVRITSNSMALDLAVRFAHRGLGRFREAVLARPSPSQLWMWVGPQVLPLVHLWASTGARRRPDGKLEKWAADVARWFGASSFVVDAPRPPHQKFTEGLIEETLSRLGDIPELLSTPSRVDGSLSVDDLALRLKRAQRRGVGPYDLVQALLRLEPAHEADAARFEKISTPVWPERKRTFGRMRSVDAGQIVAEWIRAGGLPTPWVMVDASSVRIVGVRLPLPPVLVKLDGLSELCDSADLIKRNVVQPLQKLRQADDVAHYLGVVPYWTDPAGALLGVSEIGDSVFIAKALSILVTGPGRFSIGAHHLLARMQSHPRQDARLLAIDALETLADQDRLDAGLLKTQTVALFGAGEVSLTRLASAWDSAIRAGLLAWIWPSLTGVLTEALARDRQPAGLAELIRVASAATPAAMEHGEMDQISVPLRHFAATRSSSKAAQEARALLARLDRVPL